MDRLKLLLREPALLIDAFETVVVFLVAYGLFDLSGDQQRDLIALFIAVLALLKGFLTQPFPVTVIPDLGRAALVFFGSVGVLHLTADQVTIAVTMLGTLMTVLMRAQITPVNDPVIGPAGAGAGPVRGEAGAISILAALGLVLLVGGILLMIFKGITVLALVLALVGVVVLVVGIYQDGGRRLRP